MRVRPWLAGTSVIPRRMARAGGPDGVRLTLANEGLEKELELERGERSPEAAMRAAAERKLRVGLRRPAEEPLGSEGGGLGVQARVAVNALGVDQDEHVGAKQPAADREGLDRAASRRDVNRGSRPEYLLRSGLEVVALVIRKRPP
jgi:hypothetical protein